MSQRHAREKFYRRMQLANETIVAADTIPEDLPGHFFAGLAPGELRLDFPYDRDLAAKVLWQIKNHWRITWKHLYPSYLHFTLRYKPNEEIFLTLIFDAEREGSTCKLVEIGEKTVKEKVYKMECQDE